MVRSPRLLPALLDHDFSNNDLDIKQAILMLKELELDLLKERDNLQAAKISQAAPANKNRTNNPTFQVGDLVWLSTSNRRREYKAKGEGRVHSQAYATFRLPLPYHKSTPGVLYLHTGLTQR